MVEPLTEDVDNPSDPKSDPDVQEATKRMEETFKDYKEAMQEWKPGESGSGQKLREASQNMTEAHQNFEKSMQSWAGEYFEDLTKNNPQSFPEGEGSANVMKGMFDGTEGNMTLDKLDEFNPDDIDSWENDKTKGGETGNNYRQLLKESGNKGDFNQTIDNIKKTIGDVQQKPLKAMGVKFEFGGSDEQIKKKGFRNDVRDQYKKGVKMYRDAGIFEDGDENFPKAPTDDDFSSPAKYKEYQGKFNEALKDAFRKMNGRMPDIDNVDWGGDMEKKAGEVAKKAKVKIDDAGEKKGGMSERGELTDEGFLKKFLKILYVLGSLIAIGLTLGILNHYLNEMSVANSGCMLRHGTSTTLVPINMSSGNCTGGKVVGTPAKFPNLQFYDLGANGLAGKLTYPLAGYCGCLPDKVDLSKVCSPENGTVNFPECISQEGGIERVDYKDTTCTGEIAPVTASAIPRCNQNAPGDAKDIIIYEFQLRSGIGALLQALAGVFPKPPNIGKIIKTIIIVVLSIVLVIVFFKVILPLIIKASKHRGNNKKYINVNIKSTEAVPIKTSKFNNKIRQLKFNNKIRQLKFENWRI